MLLSAVYIFCKTRGVNHQRKGNVYMKQIENNKACLQNIGGATFILYTDVLNQYILHHALLQNESSLFPSSGQQSYHVKSSLSLHGPVQRLLRKGRYGNHYPISVTWGIITPGCHQHKSPQPSYIYIHTISCVATLPVAKLSSPVGCLALTYFTAIPKTQQLWNK